LAKMVQDGNFWYALLKNSNIKFQHL